VTSFHRHERRHDDDHKLIVREEKCGCIRLRCTQGHSPEEILEALDVGLTLDDLLCEQHRRPW
jgi:hypothetical protein